jgi:tetratricopeptide (TPR) repeat protein
MLGDAEQIGAPDAIGAAHSVVAWSYMGRGMADDAIRAYEQAQAAAIRAGDKNMMAIAEDNLGIQNYRAARFAAARLHLDRAVELYRQMAHEIRAVNSIQTLGRILLAEGDLDGAAEQAEIARSATMRGQDRWLADCLDLIGGIQIMRGEWTAAARGFEQALEVRERVGHLAGIVKSLLGMGLAAEHGGEPARAEQLYRRAVSTAELMDPGPQRLAAYRRLGRLLLRQGNPESSVSLASALALADEIPESIEVAPTLVAAGEAQLADRPAEALVLLDRGLAARPTADVAIEAHALAAQAAMALGRSADGRRHAQTSVRLAQRMGSPWLIALAERASARTEAMRG